MSAEIVTIVAGQNLYKKGDPPSNCFILQKGSVHILNESGQKVAGVSPNMLFGEIEIFAGFKERETEAVCVTSGAAVSVPAEVLNNKLASLNKSQANLLIEVAKNAIKKMKPVPKKTKPLVLKKEVQEVQTKKDTVSETKSSLTFGS